MEEIYQLFTTYYSNQVKVREKKKFREIKKSQEIFLFRINLLIIYHQLFKSGKSQKKKISGKSRKVRESFSFLKEKIGDTELKK